MRHQVVIEYAELEGHPTFPELITAKVKNKYAPDVEVAHQQEEQTKIDLSAIEGEIAAKSEECATIPRLIYLPGSDDSGGGRPSESYMTAQDRMQIGFVIAVILLLLVGDVWYFRAGFNNSEVADLIGIDPSAKDNFQVLLFCFPSLGIILILKLIPQELLKDQEKWFRNYWAVLSGASFLFFAIWVLAWMDGVHPILLAQPGDITPATAKSPLGNLISAFFIELNVPSLYALLICGLAGSISGSAALWIYVDHILKKKRIDLPNPAWQHAHKELRDLKVNLEKIRAKQIESCRQRAILEAECALQIDHHNNHCRLFLQGLRRARLKEQIDSLVEEVSSYQKEIANVRREMEGYKESTTRNSLAEMQRELAATSAPIHIVFREPHWESDAILSGFQSRLNNLLHLLQDAETTLSLTRKQLHDLESTQNHEKVDPV